MRGGALPPALLFAALGLALCFAPRRALAACLIGTMLVAFAASFARINPDWRDAVFLGCWASVLITSASVHLPRGLGFWVSVALALNAGLWAGVVVAASGASLDLLKASPAVLLCIPGRWLVATNRQIVVKVIASWLIAVALLAGTLQITTPTPGYVPDHMD